MPPPPHPDQLHDFPRHQLSAGSGSLYRIHLHEREPNWFGATGGGRFDPPTVDTGFGTCYVAMDLDGALVEVFGRVRTITETDCFRRSVTTLGAAIDLELADFTHRSVVGRFGLTAAASSGNVYTYPMCQQWAAALRAAGFGGIFYRARHDPSLESSCAAVFGGPGLDDKPLRIESTTPLAESPDALSALVRFGFQVLPATEVP